MSQCVVGPIYRLSIDQTAGAVDDRTDPDESATPRRHFPKGRRRQAPLRRPDIEFAAAELLTLILIWTLVRTLTIRSLSRSTSATS
jgi:hypothetical protein